MADQARTSMSSVVTGSVENIVGEMIRETSESLVKGMANRSDVVRSILAKYKLPEIVTKFIGITFGGLIQKAIERFSFPAGVNKETVASIVNEVIQGLSSGVAEAATNVACSDGGTPEDHPGSTRISAVSVLLKNDVFRSLDGRIHLAVVLSRDARTGEVTRGRVLCPAVQADMIEWNNAHPPTEVPRTGKDGKTTDKMIKKPGDLFPGEFMPYEHAKFMTVNPDCASCNGVVVIECRLKRASEDAEASKDASKPNPAEKPVDWDVAVGDLGRWLTRALAASVPIERSDFINEMRKCPPIQWSEIADDVHRRLQASPPELPQEEVERIIKILSGFGVMKIEITTKVHGWINEIKRRAVFKQWSKKKKWIIGIVVGIPTVVFILTFVLFVHQLFAQ